MRAIKTPATTTAIRHPSGDPDQSLPARMVDAAGPAGLVQPGDPSYHMPLILSVWAPDPRERAALACGANVELAIWGSRQPPVGIGITYAAHERGMLNGPSIWAELEQALARDLTDLLHVFPRMLGDRCAPDALVRLGELERTLRLGLAELERMAQEPPQ